MLKFSNIIITGASSGIGEALALYYASAGAATLFISGRNEERLNQVAESCRLAGAEVFPQVIDVTSREVMEQWIHDCAEQAQIDLVIANAGISSVDDSPDSSYQTFNTNIFGVLNTVLPAVEAYRRHPKTTPRAIAVVASIAGYHGLPSCPDYSATKACVKA